MPRAGGWADQPLALLHQVWVIEQVYQAYAAKNREGFDWNQLAPLQVELIKWIERDEP